MTGMRSGAGKDMRSATGDAGQRRPSTETGLADLTDGGKWKGGKEVESHVTAFGKVRSGLVQFSLADLGPHQAAQEDGRVGGLSNSHSYIYQCILGR